MGIFLYYLPDPPVDAKPRPVVAERLKFQFADECASQSTFDAQLSEPQLVRGPDGKNGLLVYAPPVNSALPLPGRLGYYGEGQEWTDCGKFWLGINRAEPPTPEMLVRRETINGYGRVLGDGNTWECPIVRRAVTVPMVPCDYRVDGSGQVRRRPMDQYEKLWQSSAGWLAESLTTQERFAGAVQCLSANYRLGPHEVSVLRLLNDRTVDDVINAAIDVDWLESALADPRKKKDVEAHFRMIFDSTNDEEPTSPGETEVCPDTSPPTRT